MSQIVVNKTLRPLVIPMQVSENRDGRALFEPVILKPGSNEVDDRLRATMDKSATVKFWIEKEMIEIPKAEKADADGLEGYDAASASKLIADCFDVATLDRWHDTEKRKEVKTALSRRKRELDKLLAKEA